MRHIATFSIGLAAFLTSLGWTPSALAQRGTIPYAQPKDALRRALLLPRTLPGRDEQIRQAIKGLRNIQDLRDALALPNWAPGDQSYRRQIAQVFTDRINAGMKSSSPSTRQAAAAVLGEIGTTISGFSIPGTLGLGTSLLGILGSPMGADPFLAWDLILGRDTNPAIRNEGGFIRSFTGQLVALLKDPDPQVRQMAAHALGRVNPEPALAISALRDLLKSSLASDRQAAADGLYSMIQVVSALQGTGSGRGTILVQASREEVMQIAELVVGAAHLGLQDDNAKVRQVCLLVIQKTALTLESFLLTPGEREEMAPQEHQELSNRLAAFQPILTELKNQGGALARLMNDANPEVQTIARRTLEELANIRYRLRRIQSTLGLLPEDKPPRIQTLREQEGLLRVSFMQRPLAADPLAEGLRPAVDVLKEGVKNPNVGDRLISLGLLELLGEAAAPAAPAIIQAMSDPNKFVRWAAGRTLAHTGPIDQKTADEALPVLEKMLADPDLDLRITAATTLARFGPLVSKAVPALTRVTQHGDAEIRIAAMRTLVAVGLEQLEPEIIDKVIAAVATGLANPDARARRAAAQTLGRFGPRAKAAIPALRKALHDENAEVRLDAGEALLDISGL